MDEAARAALLAWYRRHRRDLPWRRTTDPYAIWVSEAMLQQTRVETVVPYYGRWLARWPTVAALGRADEQEVLAAWSGLGYYSRARNLRLAAQGLQRRGKPVPPTVEGLRALPGVGPYTAAAVASIAFGAPVACVDGNVVRVVARVAGIRVLIRPPTRKRIEAMAQQWLSVEAPGDWNQAMMELGATVCTPRKPRCPECPVAAACRSKGRDPEAIPRQPRKAPATPQRMQFAVVRRKNAILLVRSPAKGLLGGLLALPGGAAGPPLARQVQAQTGILATPARTGTSVRHRFTHRTWEMRVRAAVYRSGKPAAGARWVPESGLRDAALSTAMRKALRACGVEA